MMDEDSSARITVRPALPQERIAIGACRWPGLSRRAGSAAWLWVAVAGRRELLLGCAWQVPSPCGVEAGVAVSPGMRLEGAATAALIAAIRPDPVRTVHWSGWLGLDDARLPALREAGFTTGQQMMTYEIPNHPKGHERLEKGFGKVAGRMEKAGFEWGGLDREAAAEVRLATVQEGLMGGAQFDSLYLGGSFDAGVSPVVRQNGRMCGFIVVMSGEPFEVALLYIRRELRSTGLNALLLAEVIRRKTEATPDWRRIVFRGNLEANPRTRRMCLRFGGHEDVACLKMILPPR